LLRWRALAAWVATALAALEESVSRCRVKKVINSHWFCIVPLLPFVAMLAVHRALHLSNAFGGVKVGERHPTDGELAYNYLMVLVFYLGVGGFLAHAAFLQLRGTVWMLLKFGALALAWSALIHYGSVLF
jgi:hypothetical protein